MQSSALRFRSAPCPPPTTACPNLGNHNLALSNFASEVLTTRFPLVFLTVTTAANTSFPDYHIVFIKRILYYDKSEITNKWIIMQIRMLYLLSKTKVKILQWQWSSLIIIELNFSKLGMVTKKISKLLSDTMMLGEPSFAYHQEII